MHKTEKITQNPVEIFRKKTIKNIYLNHVFISNKSLFLHLHRIPLLRAVDLHVHVVSKGLFSQVRQADALIETTEAILCRSCLFRGITHPLLKLEFIDPRVCMCNPIGSNINRFNALWYFKVDARPFRHNECIQQNCMICYNRSCETSNIYTR